MAASFPTTDRLLGALLGTAVGDALGMPIGGFSHQNVRMFYRGIKEYRDDERRGELKAGQWTAHTQRTFALVRAMMSEPNNPEATAAAFQHELEGIDLRRYATDSKSPTNAVAVAVAPIGVFAARRGWSGLEIISWIEELFGQTHGHPSALSAGVGQAFAVSEAIQTQSTDGPAFILSVADVVLEAEVHFGGHHHVSDRLRGLSAHVDEFPLDLQDRCNGTGAAADESFPFAIAMFARGSELAEASLLSAINVGGDANSIGAMLGALLGARNGWSAFLEAWRTGLEDVERLTAKVQCLIDVL